jgi:hypothetical protein
MPAPTIAIGMINQLAQPSSGMNATSAQMSAMKPMKREIRLNIVAGLARSAFEPELLGGWSNLLVRVPVALALGRPGAFIFDQLGSGERSVKTYDQSPVG